MDVLRLDVLEVDPIDARAVLHVVGHARRRDDIFQRQRGVLRELRGAVRRTGKRPPRCGAQALGVDGAHALDDLEQPRPSGHAHGLQRGRDGQANRFLRAPLIRDDQMGIHGIQSALNALDRSIEGFQVDGDIGPLFHASTPPYPYTALLYTKIIVLESRRPAEILRERSQRFGGKGFGTWVTNELNKSGLSAFTFNWLNIPLFPKQHGIILMTQALKSLEITGLLRACHSGPSPIFQLTVDAQRPFRS